MDEMDFTVEVSTGAKSYVFSFPLTVELSELVQTEGMDMKMVSLADIISGEIYSDKFKRYFKVAEYKNICMLAKTLFAQLRKRCSQ